MDISSAPRRAPLLHARRGLRAAGRAPPRRPRQRRGAGARGTVDQESSAARTISYTCALALLAALAADLGGDDAIRRALDQIPDHLAGLLGQTSWAELAARFAERQRYYFIGGGPNTATAYEAALKMNEANHATALGFNCEQFLHGPW